MLHIFFLAFSIFLLVLAKSRRNAQKIRRPPGPPGLPLIGNLHQMDNLAPYLYLHELAKKYGPFMSLQLGSVQTLVVSSAKMAKEVMKTHDHVFANRPLLLGMQKLSYSGLDVAFSPTNEYWKEMRKVVAHHLCSVKRVQSFRGSRENEVSRMIKRISNLSKSSSKAVNLSEIVMSLSCNIICMVAFGKRYEDEGNERSRFHGLLNECQAMMGSFYVSDHFPLLGWVDRVTGLSSRLEKTFRELDEFYQELIDDHLSSERPELMHEDFLDTLLRLKEEKSTPFDMTLNHIKALLMNVFVGATDTGAALMIWVMTALIKNPKAMGKAQEEVRKTVGKKDMVDEDDVQKLPYLHAVIKEILRLYPPGPLLMARETVDKCIIDDYEIQPKTLVYISAWAIGRDPEAWENPEDFMPERFVGSNIDFRGQDFQFIPFGAGRRGCPGTNMGMATVEVALANLLYSFDWAPPKGTNREDIDTNPLPGLAMHKKNDLRLVASQYRHV